MLFGKGGGSREGSVVGSWSALSVSLAGVLGVGNIAGVCVAISAGGPGAIFWMWLSSLLAMPLKYAEIYLGVKYKKKSGGSDGSPMLYTEGLRGGRFPAALYAAVCVIAAFTLGNITQTGAVADAITGAMMTTGEEAKVVATAGAAAGEVEMAGTGEAAEVVATAGAAAGEVEMAGTGEAVAIATGTGAVGLARAAVGVFIALVSAVLISGRFEKLAKLTSAVVPFMSAAYIALCTVVIICRADRLPAAFASVFRCAFSTGCAPAGAAGWSVAAAIGQGTVKGCFSHEAGSGTAVFAHAHAGAKPEKQACFGLFEVFFDTAVVCSLTAFAVLSSGVDLSLFGYSGTACVLAAFEGVLGAWAGKAVSLCISLFAFATVLCWSSYGLTAVNYLSPTVRSRRVYLVFYCAAAVAGAFLRSKTVWALTDAAVLSLTFLNLISLMRRRREILPPDLTSGFDL